jgi:uncharacterized protein YbjT (DUF2867 family)
MTQYSEGVPRVVLVTGATGNVGRQVVAQLVSSGVAVRALTRKPEGARLPHGVEVVRGDQSEPDSLDEALNGVDGVFLMWPFLPVNFAAAVVEKIAKRARRIVFLSTFGVRDDLDEQLDPVTAFHARIERLIEQAGWEWTFVRAGGFATNTLLWAPQIRADGVVRWPYGAAARSLIHERDIAAVAVRALTSDGHAGAKYVLTGPQSLTQVEQVRAIGEAIGRSLRYEELSPEAARLELLGYLPPPLVEGMLGHLASCVVKPEQVSSTVEAVTGSPARTLREWAADHAGDFRRGGQ